jgi:hypothetical protein|tara:strand:- start:158 stop:427 length:270 start_codon:yes stop_codon:yes gene_type:complete
MVNDPVEELKILHVDAQMQMTVDKEEFIWACRTVMTIQGAPMPIEHFVVYLKEYFEDDEELEAFTEKLDQILKESETRSEYSVGSEAVN